MPDLRVSVADRSAVHEVIVRVPALGMGDLLATAGGQRLMRMPWVKGASWGRHDTVALPLVLPSLAEWAKRCEKEGVKVIPDPNSTRFTGY